MNDFKHLPITDYLARAASESPTPGGGSVASLVGAMGAALGQMVYNLTHTKKSYLENDEITKAAVRSDYNALVRLQEELADLIDKDIMAFNSFMDALSLPKATDEEKAVRRKAMAEATVIATQAPLETATKSFEVLQHLGSLSRYGHKNCISDAGVSAYLAHAALKSAVMNVRINIPGLDDKAFAESAERTCIVLLEEADKLMKEIEVIVYERL